MVVPAVLATVQVDPSRPTSVTPYGLFSVGPVLPLTRAVAVEWENRVCVDVHETISECFTGEAPDPKDFTGVQHWQMAPPFTLYAATNCPPEPGDNPSERVTDKIVAGEQVGVEQAFHAQVLSQTPDVVGNALSPLHAVARMEQALAAAYGVPGVIHMSREMFTLISGLDVQHVSGQLRTELGTPIAAGGGYPFEPIIYGTGPIRIYRGDQQITEGLNFENNEDNFLVERSYVVAADLCDEVFAVTGITPIP
jgi:hypothetical protein